MDVEAYLAAARAQARDADRLRRSLRLPPGAKAVNVHSYGWDAYEAFIRKFYSDDRPRVVALSMNPGPFGAVQTGIPFCDTRMARGFLPNFDELIAKKPAWLRADRAEVSALKIVEWSRRRFGGLEGLYRNILLAMTCPIGILKGPNRVNVPLPALARTEQKKVEDFIRRHGPAEILAAEAPAVLVLGDWALKTWRILQAADERLAKLPWAQGPHPAAHITNQAKYGAWTRCFDGRSTSLKTMPLAPIG
ncbi:MAG TPA: hypothetical protein VI818_08570 [Candidatus Thermoplasmatota archaeon]|nr:hypothetical protein [Candidatus Thermoplasmatota archaeon]